MSTDQGKRVLIRIVPKTITLLVYKISNPAIKNEFYVGSTTSSLYDRFNKHVRKANECPNRKVYRCCGGIENCQIDLLEQVDLPVYNFNLQRAKKEQEWIDFLKPVWNTNSAHRTPEQKKEYHKKWNRSQAHRDSQKRYRENKKQKKQKI